MNRECPHCGKEIHVFDEECPACGKPSKPGLLLAIASILHGYRSMFLLVAALLVSWIILWKLFDR
jgi:predicted amidophosphoribosyltransferase